VYVIPYPSANLSYYGGPYSYYSSYDYYGPYPGFGSYRYFGPPPLRNGPPVIAFGGIGHGPPPGALARVVERIVAVVNSSILLQSDLNARIRPMMSQIAEISDATLRNQRLEQRRRSAQEGMNVFFLLDRSDSIPSVQQEAAREYVSRVSAEKRKTDNVGVLVFGSEASIESSPLSVVRSDTKIYAVVDGQRTDIASAVRLGSAAFPETGQKRLFLLFKIKKNFFGTDTTLPPPSLI
jgi:hypothetical protein